MNVLSHSITHIVQQQPGFGICQNVIGYIIRSVYNTSISLECLSERQIFALIVSCTKDYT